MLPVVVENPRHLRSGTIFNKNIHASLAAEGVVRFTNFKEDLLEDLLPHIHHMLENTGFKGGGTHRLALTKSTEDVVEEDCRTNP